LSHTPVPRRLAHEGAPLDQQVFLFFNADRGRPWLDSFWAVLSSLDFWMPFLVLAGLLILWRGGFRARAMLVCLLLSVGLMEGGLTNPLKKLISRQRPYYVHAEARSLDLAPARPRFLALGQPLNIRPARFDEPLPDVGKSLPSGHTMNMFCFATVLAAFYRWRGAWFFLPATLVALSRVATGSHWPSDIVISAVLSIATTLVLLRLYGLIWRKFAPRIAPGLAAAHPRLLA